MSFSLPNKPSGKRIFDELFVAFQPRKEGTSRVPVFVETSDFLWARIRNLMENRESFRAFHLDVCPKPELQRDLVGRTLEGFAEPVFTEVWFSFVFFSLWCTFSHLFVQAEFDQVWEFSGGHQGTFYTLHQRLQMVCAVLFFSYFSFGTHILLDI